MSSADPNRETASPKRLDRKDSFDRTADLENKSSRRLQSDIPAKDSENFNERTKDARNPEKRLTRKTTGRGTYGECAIADIKNCGKNKDIAVELKNGLPEKILFQNQSWQRDNKNPAIWHVQDGNRQFDVKADVSLKGEKLSIRAEDPSGKISNFERGEWTSSIPGTERTVSEADTAGKNGTDSDSTTRTSAVERAREIAAKLAAPSFPIPERVYPENPTKLNNKNGVVSDTTVGNVQTIRYSDGTSETWDGISATRKGPDGSIHADHNYGEVVYDSVKLPDQSTKHTSRSHDSAYDYKVISFGKDKWQAFDSSNKPYELSKDKQAATERTNLCTGVEAQMKDPEQLARFRADIAKFENRIHDPKEIVETYKQIERLMGPNAKLNDERRMQLASEVMSQAATPTSVDQGRHNTCNVTAVECKIYTDCPSKAAKVVAEVACTGSYEYAKGKSVRIDQNTSFYSNEYDKFGNLHKVSRTCNSFKPDEECSQKYIADGNRTFASQLFQVAAVNSVYASEGKNDRYVQLPHPAMDSKVNLSEKLLQGPNIMKESPGLSDPQIAKAYRLLAGDKAQPTVYIEHADFVSGGVGPGIETYKDMKGFEDKLSKAKLPIIFAVNTKNEPFFSDSGRGTAGGSGGWHVITITDYKPGHPPVIRFDNQWGSHRDHGKGRELTGRQLFIASMDFDAATKQWKLEAKNAKDKGSFDPEAELEVLSRTTPKLKPPLVMAPDLAANAQNEINDFANRSAKFVNEAGDFYKSTKNEKLRSNIEEKFMVDFRNMPAEIQRKIALQIKPGALSKLNQDEMNSHKK